MTADASLDTPTPARAGGAAVAVLRSEDLTIRFGGLTALDKVDLEVARGEIRADGSYVFHGVPAGTYTLKVLEGEREIATRPVTVIEGHELAVDPIHLGAAPPAAPPAAPQ